MPWAWWKETSLHYLSQQFKKIIHFYPFLCFFLKWGMVQLSFVVESGGGVVWYGVCIHDICLIYVLVRMEVGCACLCLHRNVKREPWLSSITFFYQVPLYVFKTEPVFESRTSYFSQLDYQPESSSNLLIYAYPNDDSYSRTWYCAQLVTLVLDHNSDHHDCIPRAFNHS